MLFCHGSLIYGVCALSQLALMIVTRAVAVPNNDDAMMSDVVECDVICYRTCSYMIMFASCLEHYP